MKKPLLIGLSVLGVLIVGSVAWFFVRYFTDPIFQCRTNIAKLDWRPKHIERGGMLFITEKILDACYSPAQQACVVMVQSDMTEDTPMRTRTFEIKEIGTRRVLYEKSVTNEPSVEIDAPLDTSGFDRENQQATKLLNCMRW